MSESEQRNTTDTRTSVTIRVWARCPKCGKTIERILELGGESLTAGNTTERASYAAEAMRLEVATHKVRRQWSSDQCAACGDP